MSRILLITDAWAPQINGVVRTYQNLLEILKSSGHTIDVMHPYMPGLKRKQLKSYSEIEIVTNPWKMKDLLLDYIAAGYRFHIATEGPLGLYARQLLIRKKCYFTSSYHTAFPEFFREMYNIPIWLTYPFFKWFHMKSKAILVPTHAFKNTLENRGFRNIEVWTRGVDGLLFNPKNRIETQPYIVCVSRASKEKNIDAFCQLKHEKKVFVGDGPYLAELQSKYPDVHFVGKKEGVELAQLIASADVFVFPSLTDTFGIVILESIACGTPVAAYPEPGPVEVIENDYNGHYSDNLQESMNRCQALNRREVYESSKQWTWRRSAQQFMENI